MKKDKKILMIGPPGVGKTTIKQVFFEIANPIELLKNPLKPTKGVATSIYTFFDLKLSIFDLAGQEIENWFREDKYVFFQSNIIICVLDIRSYLKDIFHFLWRVIKIFDEFKLKTCHFVVFLHKIDLIDAVFLRHKLRAINVFLAYKKYVKSKVTIYTTSIVKEFFLKTYDIVSELLINLIQEDSIFINPSPVQNLKNEFKILLHYDYPKQHKKNDLFYDLSLPKNDIDFHLERLERLGFVELESTQNFKLTERAYLFKAGLEKITKNNEINKETYQIKKILDCLFLFSNLDNE